MITAPHPVTPATIPQARALIVGLALIPLTLVIIASIPALVIMPFTPGGITRVETFASWMTAWNASIMVNSRSHP
jgi:hypothetical protein